MYLLFPPTVSTDVSLVAFAYSNFANANIEDASTWNDPGPELLLHIVSRFEVTVVPCSMFF